MFWQMLIWVAFAEMSHFQFYVMRTASGLMVTDESDVNATTARAAQERK